MRGVFIEIQKVIADNFVNLRVIDGFITGFSQCEDSANAVAGNLLSLCQEDPQVCPDSVYQIFLFENRPKNVIFS